MPVFFSGFSLFRYNSTMNLQPGKSAVDYLIVGHITRDIIEKGFRLGGTAVYSGILAKRMGLNVGLVTSYNEETPVEPLNGIQIISQRAKRTTTFNWTKSRQNGSQLKLFTWDRLPGRSARKSGLIFQVQPCVFLSRAG